MQFHYRTTRTGSCERRAVDGPRTKELSYVCRGEADKVSQAKQDIGTVSLIDIVSAVMCSMKGPINLIDKNKYMINFVGEKSNYCTCFTSENKGPSCEEIRALLIMVRAAI